MEVSVGAAPEPTTERVGVLHSDGSIVILPPGSTPPEAAAEASLTALAEDGASAVLVTVGTVEYLGPRVGQSRAR